MSETYKVVLDSFEGPLDLLLHLVNELEINIYDIPVAEITDQYMHYIHTMQRIELNVASEYLVMAATLLAMKSAMLLPKKEIAYEEEYEEDPREELMARLMEYRKYKEAADQLKEKELEENQIYTRPPLQWKEEAERQEVTRGDISIYDMLHALNQVWERQSWHAPISTTVSRMDVSLEQRMDEVLEALGNTTGSSIRFDQLFPYPNKSHIVTTFLSLLQLLKNNQIQCSQTKQFQPIFVSLMEE